MATAKKKKKTSQKKKATKKKKSSKSGASGAAANESAITAEWEKLMAQHADLPTKSYSTKETFKLGEKLKHPQFGEGIVGKMIYPNKIEVIFKTDLKILIHQGTSGKEFRIN